MRKLLNSLHKLFDPRIHKTAAQDFALKHPDTSTDKDYDLTVHTRVEAPGDTPLVRMQVRAGAAAQQVDDTLKALQGDVSADVDVNLGRLKQALHSDRASDLVVRQFMLPFDQPVKAYLVYVQGIASAQDLELSVLRPLTEIPRGLARTTGLDLVRQVDESFLQGRQSRRSYAMGEVAGAVASGLCALLLETAPVVLLVELRQWPGRSVSNPGTEAVVRGPHEAFTETLRTNTALIRRRLNTPDLIFEAAQVGRRSRTDIAFAYLEGVVNTHLVAEVRRRISNLDIDMMHDSGTLEQLI